MSLVSALASPGSPARLTEARDALWCLGISGDLPIIAAAIGSDEQLPAARELIRRHALLRACAAEATWSF
jgi:hypothetical protein